MPRPRSSAVRPYHLTLAVAARMTTALSLGVAVGAGFAAITLAVAFHTVILVDFARAVVFTGTLHDSHPSID